MEKGAFEMRLEGRLGPDWSQLDGKGAVGRGKRKHEARGQVAAALRARSKLSKVE